MHIQASIGRGGRDKGGEYKVGTIWEEIFLAKQIDKQGSKISPKAKEDMNKVKAIALTETATIKAELKSTIALLKKIDQGQRRPTESLKR